MTFSEPEKFMELKKKFKDSNKYKSKKKSLEICDINESL